MKLFNFKKKGFSLVELLVAISILSIAILATFTAVQGSFRSNLFAEDQIIASYLGQEAIEFVRNIRDENGIKNTKAIESGGTYPWLSGIAQISTDPCYPGKFCTIDSPLKLLASCNSNASSCQVLRFDTNTGLYGYTAGWSATKYKRSISFTRISANEVRVNVDVSWQGQGISKTFSISEILRDWQ